MKFGLPSLAPAHCHLRKLSIYLPLLYNGLCISGFFLFFIFYHDRLAIGYLRLDYQHIPGLLVCHLLHSLDVNRSW